MIMVYINAAEGRNFANVNIDFSSMQNSNNGGVSTLGMKNGTDAGVGTGKKIRCTYRYYN